jgi:hypothetical protein
LSQPHVDARPYSYSNGPGDGKDVCVSSPQQWQENSYIYISVMLVIGN